MSEDHKKQLEQQLWNIANALRGKMNADEFRDYILGFIFYKYLSERMHLYADKLLKQDEITYQEIDEDSAEGQEILEAVKEESIEQLGYFLKPSELFHALANRGNGNGKKGTSPFILDDLARILNNIEQSTMGTASEDDFDKLFEDLDLTSTKLGRTESAKNELISKVLYHLDQIDFHLEDTNLDVLGDAYEYLIGKFASGAGKKAGEFYTPQEVSKILAKLVTAGKQKLKSVYDPTCGSGSLLLRVAKEVESVGSFYGQEMNRTTYNLARMNMILHGVHYRKFDIRQEDTLEHPQHLDLRFEAIVANPPFSAKWSANPLHLSDDRFSQYGKLAPKSYADFAFICHMIYHLEENGQMAIVLPHGALSRKGSEAHIRQFLIEDRNYLDAVIGLPLDIFYGTEIPTCILVLKKCRENPDDVFFIDASNYYEQFKTKNRLREEDIDRIISAYQARENIEDFSKRIPLSKIQENEFNLNISRYIDAQSEKESVTLLSVYYKLKELDSIIAKTEDRISKYCHELSIPAPNGTNLSLLKLYRKGVVEGLMTQKFRFDKKENLKFPDWEQTTLGAVSSRVLEKNSHSKFKNVLTNSAAKGIINQQDYFEKNIANLDNLDGYYIVDVDDFVYNPRISKSAPVGPIKRNKVGKGVMSPLYLVFRFKKHDLTFLEYYFESSLWHRYMRSIASYGARYDRMNISKEDFFKMPIPIPYPEEQQKIGKFMSEVDKKIMLIGEEFNSIQL